MQVRCIPGPVLSGHFPGKQGQGELASGRGRSPSPYVRPRRAGQEGRGCSPVCGVTQVRRRLGRRAGAAWAPGDVDEDEPLDAGQLHLLLLHLQPEGPVQAAGVADLLQPDPHVHALVVEPGGGLRVMRGPSPESWLVSPQEVPGSPAPPVHPDLLLNLPGSSSRAWWKSRLSSASMPIPQ